MEEDEPAAEGQGASEALLHHGETEAEAARLEEDEEDEVGDQDMVATLDDLDMEHAQVRETMILDEGILEGGPVTGLEVDAPQPEPAPVTDEPDAPAGVTASQSAPMPTGHEEEEKTSLLTLDNLRALRSRADALVEPHLVWREGREERLVNLPDRLAVIGKDNDCDVVIPGGLMVAGHHADLVKRGETYTIKPNTWYGKVQVNGKTIKGTHPLSSGDRIQIGEIEMEFRLSIFEDD